jgi:hypothetical protein
LIHRICFAGARLLIGVTAAALGLLATPSQAAVETLLAAWHEDMHAPCFYTITNAVFIAGAPAVANPARLAD